MPIDCAIIGTGPAALLAATELVKHGRKPVLFERRNGPGWKLLVAGSSGLNVSYECPENELPFFFVERRPEIAACLKQFGRADWLRTLQELGEETYLGSSRRYFLRRHKASQLLSSWVEMLSSRGAEFVLGEELSGIEPGETQEITFASGRRESVKTLLLALGGGSWEPHPPAWPRILSGLGLVVEPFSPSNAGFELSAPAAFFAEADGQAIKGLILRTRRGERQGELLITRYGLEGTPVYSVGCSGPATLDLKPELSEAALEERLLGARGTLWQRVENSARLSRGALLLAKQFAPEGSWQSPHSAASILKNFPLELGAPRPLEESISSRGGLSWDELNGDLELRRFPGIFCAGEMVDWDAPTGGFLIQACVAMGYVAAHGILKR
jgi:predicted Rossmann fold flavoprotein